MTLPVKVGEHARADLGRLDQRLLEEAFGLLVRLTESPRLGRPLEEHGDVGDLSDCRKIYFNETRHRIVYRLVPSDEAPSAVEVIAVGPRADLRVYYDAVRRLGRTPGVDAPGQ